jgi:hypothetical protein
MCGGNGAEPEPQGFALLRPRLALMSSLGRSRPCFEGGCKVWLSPHLLEKHVHVDVAVEHIDLPVFHDREVTAGNIELGSVRRNGALLATQGLGESSLNR